MLPPMRIFGKSDLATLAALLLALTVLTLFAWLGTYAFPYMGELP